MCSAANDRMFVFPVCLMYRVVVVLRNFSFAYLCLVLYFLPDKLRSFPATNGTNGKQH